MTEPYHIKVVVDSSASSIAKFKQLLSDDSPVWDAWNGISENIIVHSPNDTNVPENAFLLTIATDTLGSISAITVGELSYVGPNLIPIDEYCYYNWSSCTIFLNEIILPNQSTETIQKTITHELGHALKLSHKLDEDSFSRYSVQTNVLSIMNQGAVNENSSSNVEPNPSTTIEPTFLDKFDLIMKWGI